MERASPTPEASHRLLAWFFTHRRELPWREESDPYRVWVSEVMLQQTRSQTVLEYYRRFLERFPDVSSLAVVDGNVLRVVTRLTGEGGDPASAALRGRVREYAEKSFYNYHPGLVNQAWMELGARTCRPAPPVPWPSPAGHARRAAPPSCPPGVPAARSRSAGAACSCSCSGNSCRRHALRAALERAWAAAPAHHGRRCRAGRQAAPAGRRLSAAGAVLGGQQRPG
jgi:endonuclease III